MRHPRRRADVWTLLATLLAGGTLFGTCELRLKNALVESSKEVLLGLFDPSNLEEIDFADLLSGDGP